MPTPFEAGEAQTRNGRGSGWTLGTIALSGVVATALVVRLAIAWTGPPGPTWVDGEQYWSVARNLAAAGSYANAAPEPQGQHPYADLGPTSFWLPGYPLLLSAVVVVFGEVPRAVFLVQALLSALTVAVIGALGRRLGGWPVGVAAATLVAISPLELFQVSRFGSELLTALVLALLCWRLDAVLQAIRASRSRGWNELGLFTVCAFSVLLRSAFVPVAVMTLAWVAAVTTRRLGWRPALMSLLLATAIGALVLTPWLGRNLRLWGELVYNTKAGLNLRIGFNEFADGRYATRGVPRLERADTDELSRDRLLRAGAIDWIRENPLRALELAGRKFLLFWSPFHDQHALFSLRGGITFAWSSLLLVTAGWGVVIALRRERDRAAPLVAAILLYAGVHVAAFSAIRFRIPLDVLLALFSAHAVVALARGARQRHAAIARA